MCRRLQEEDLKWRRRGDEELILGYFEFDMHVGHTGGNIKLADDYMSLVSMKGGPN